MDGYYEDWLCAYVRGKLGLSGTFSELLEAGRAQGLRLHRFKRTAGLPRVRRVLGMLQGLAPSELLDLGTGRGVFLWPLLDELPELPVTCVDIREDRVLELELVAAGGVSRLSAVCADARALPFGAGSFDGVTALEVLEHLPDPRLAAQEAMRVARRFVIASAPSQEDDNPEHIQLFDRASITALFEGARSVKVEYVLNHLIAVALL